MEQDQVRFQARLSILLSLNRVQGRWLKRAGGDLSLVDLNRAWVTVLYIQREGYCVAHET